MKKRLPFSIMAAVMLTPGVSVGQTVWTNPVFGVITDPAEIPQSVNHFINHGFISTVNPNLFPLEVFDLLSITNTGIMLGLPGWQFNNVSSSTGTRTMAANFVNLNAGLISAFDAPVAFLPLTCEVAVVDPSYLYISATNIINRAVGTNGASLSVGPNGGLRLDGKNIDLVRGGLEVRPIWVDPQGTSTINIDGEPVWFVPDTAVHDNYWAQDSFSETYPLGSGGMWNGTVASALVIPGPPNGPSAPIPSLGFSLVNPVADSYMNIPPNSSGFIMVTNIIGDPTNVLEVVINPVFVVSNVVKGAGFVSGPPEFAAEVAFFQNTAGNFLLTAEVLLTTSLSNAVTGLDELAGVYIADTLGDNPGDRGHRANAVGCPPGATSRPVNYSADRLPFVVGSPGNNGYPEPDFFISSRSLTINEPENYGMDAVTNAVVTEGDFAGYSAFFDNVVSRPPAVPGGTVTNLPGRVRIQAENLNLSRTRVRAEGEIMIDTAHLISSTNAIIDAENLSFNLTSTNGNLQVEDVSKDFVQRLRGSIYAWSATWENTVVLLITNNWAVSNIVTTNDMGIEITNMVATQMPLTNTVSVTYHAFMVDATQLQTVLPVRVYDMHARSTNVVINDNMSLIQSLLIDGEHFTLNGTMTIPGARPPNPVTGFVPLEPPLRSWTRTNAPSLRFFTNNGTMSVANVVNFGQDRASPYANFVNAGSINAISILLASDSFENSGVLSTFGGLFIRGGTGKLDGGSSFSGNDTVIEAMDLKLNNYDLTSEQVVTLRVTNSLTDAGAGSGSIVEAFFGFDLPIKPNFGDLLGTTFQSVAPRFWQSEHRWAGQDWGNSPAGYSNNAAVGTLLLATSDFFGGHFLRGTGSGNAMYVDLLDISAMGEDYVDQLEIDPSLIIYFAAANVGFTPPADMQPEEYLDGQFGGRLRWASNFAGPNSSADVLLLNGSTIKVNRARRESLILDDDGDGVANGLDPFPFDADSWNTSLVVSSSAEGVRAQLSWNAAPQSVYQVEYATNILDLNWQPLMTRTNLGSSNDLMSILDTNLDPAEPQRFYRVRLLQQ